MRGSACSRHMRTISRGTPGMATIIVSSIRASQPGAVPTGFGSTSALGMTQACLAFRSGISKPRWAKNSRMLGDERFIDCGVSPARAAMASRVRSSSVGPMPPVQTDQVGLVDSGGQGPREAVQIVADLDDVQQLDTLGGKLLGEEGGIGVGEVTADQLAADGKHVGAGATSIRGSVGTAVCCRSEAITSVPLQGCASQPSLVELFAKALVRSFGLSVVGLVAVSYWI